MLEKIYITKYWETKGIIELECETLYKNGKAANIELIQITGKAKYSGEIFRLGYECFDDEEAAMQRVNILKQRKIISLQRKITKIESIIF